MQSKKQLNKIIHVSILMLILNLSLQAQSQPIADYFFESNLNSAQSDAPALVSLAQMPQYAVTSVAGLQKKVLVFSAGEGLQLDTSTLINNDEYSIVLLFTLDETFGYRKLIDFKHRSSDFGV